MPQVIKGLIGFGTLSAGQKVAWQVALPVVGGVPAGDVWHFWVDTVPTKGNFTLLEIEKVYSRATTKKSAVIVLNNPGYLHANYSLRFTRVT